MVIFRVTSQMTFLPFLGAPELFVEQGNARVRTAKPFTHSTLRRRDCTSAAANCLRAHNRQLCAIGILIFTVTFEDRNLSKLVDSRDLVVTSIPGTH